MKTMMLKSQECSQPKPDVIALCSTSSRLARFYSAKLLDAAMVCFYCPSHIDQLHPLKLDHLDFVCYPVFNVAVFGYKLEYLYIAVSLQMHHAAGLGNLNFADCSVSTPVRVNLAVTLELGQPKPPQGANGFEVIEAVVMKK
jgi:hypothetical protein